MSAARDRASLIAHAELPFCSPLSLSEVDALLDAAAVSASDRVLDVGGGRGDLAIRCAIQHGAIATTVDRSAVFSAEARARALATPAVSVIEDDAAQFLEREHPRNVAVACCLGSTHALGGLVGATTTLRALVGPAGRVIVGDLVALGPRAEAAFEIPRDRALDGDGIVHRMLLLPDRIRAYEERWAAALERHLVVHRDAAIEEWARERIAWMKSPDVRAAREELAFVALVLEGG